MIAGFHSAILLLTFTSWGRKQPGILGIAVYASIAWVIIGMCIMSGGHQSPYYAGLNLVIIGYSLLTPWSFRDTTLAIGIVYVSYLVSIFAFDKVNNIAIFVNNNFFITCTSLIMIVASYVWQLFREEQFIDREKLKSLDRAKSNFLATISHELKTPMTLIVNPIEQAVAASGGEKAVLEKDQVETVQRNVHRLSTMISDLLEISRGVIGKSHLVPSDVHDVRKLIEDLFHSMAPLFQEKGVTADLEVNGPLKPHFFDVKKIDKVLYNLLSNALKFTLKGGSVTMKAWDEGGILKISVTDTGIGIPPDKLPTIFARFAQVEQGDSRSYEGMGIGLSLVKDFVEQHGGEAVAESQPGKGSKFTVTLPRGREYFRVPAVTGSETQPLSEQRLDFTRELITQTAVRETLPPLAKIREKTGAKTILVVEDSLEMRNTIIGILSGEYNLVAAENGKQGLAKAKEVKPDLIVTDIMMPEMDGYQMVKEIRREERLKEIPVILLTAKSGEEGLAEGFEAGANDYLTKPFSPSELLLRVQNHLLMQEMKAELVRQQNLASIGTLSAGISHNMNTFAAGVAASLSLAKVCLKEQNLPDEGRQEIERSLNAAKDALQAIKDMINALEIYSQKNVEGFREENIVETTKAVVDLAHTKVPAHVKIDFDAPRIIQCYYNPHILNPALMNLLDNAGDACQGRSDAKIAVSVENGDNGTVLITVQDNGHGIPREIQHRIWDPYFTTKNVGSGTGLGLWMVRRAVELDHGGKVWFDANESGTVFYVQLPKKGGDHERNAPEKNPVHRG